MNLEARSAYTWERSRADPVREDGPPDILFDNAPYPARNPLRTRKSQLHQPLPANNPLPKALLAGTLPYCMKGHEFAPQQAMKQGIVMRRGLPSRRQRPDFAPLCLSASLQAAVLPVDSHSPGTDPVHNARLHSQKEGRGKDFGCAHCGRSRGADGG